MKICSLFPAATEILYALGLSSAVAGVSHECDYPLEVQNKPRITRSSLDQDQLSSQAIDARVRAAIQERRSLYTLDIEAIKRIGPDVIVTQSLCHVCAVDEVSLKPVLGALQLKPRVISLHAHTLEGVLSEIRLLGYSLNRSQEAFELVQSLTRRLESVRQRAAATAHSTVGCIEWMDPLMVAGHWVPEMVAVAGAQDAFARPGEPSRCLGWQELIDVQPDWLLLMPCGFSIERTRGELPVLAQHPQWLQLKAVEEGRVRLLDGPSFFNCPGPRLVDGVELLAGIFHPEL